MSTTSAADLLDRAHVLTRDLRRGDTTPSRAQWDAFDDTVHRLMTNLLGPHGRNIPVRSEQRVQLVAIAKTYPTPLRDNELSTGLAPRVGRPAAFREIAHAQRRAHLRLVAQDDSAVPTLPEVDLPSATDPHPMARLTCTLGALADLLHDAPPLGPSAQRDMADATARILSVASVAARHTLTGCRIQDAASLEDAARILEVAVWAERSIDRLGSRSLDAASLEHIGATIADRSSDALNDRLEVARTDWSAAARAEVGLLIPSVDVMRVIANQSAHLYGVTAQLLRQDPDLAKMSNGVVPRLSWAAEAFRAADQEWVGITALSRPSNEFLSEARSLLSVINEVARHNPTAALESFDGRRAFRDLVSLSSTIADLAAATRDLPGQLARSHLLFGSRDKLADSTRRLNIRPSKRAIPLSLEDTIGLQARWGEACLTAGSVAHELVTHLGRPDLDLGPVQRTLR